MTLYFDKIYVFVLLIVCRLISGLSPLLITKKLKKKYVLDNVSKKWVEKGVSYSMDFSGGILLATAFIHMIPEVRDHLFHILGDKYVFPYAETLVCVGFFAVYVIEELVKQLLQEKVSHTAKGDALISVKEAEPRLLDISTTTKMRVNERDSDQGDNLNIQMTPVEMPLTGEVNSTMVRDDINECNNNTKSMNNNNLKHLLLVSALSFHSVMEGLAIGLATSIQDLWYLFLAVMLHECTILLCVGIELVANCSSTSMVIKYMAVLALVSPAGVFVGTMITILVSEGGSSEVVFIYFLQGLAAGTILYVTFFEVLNNHKHHHNHPQPGGKKHHDHHSESGLSKLVFIALGFMFMIVLELLSGHEIYHNHEHGNNCGNDTS